jgi:hypothetical protein
MDQFLELLRKAGSAASLPFSGMPPPMLRSLAGTDIPAALQAELPKGLLSDAGITEQTLAQLPGTMTERGWSNAPRFSTTAQLPNLPEFGGSLEPLPGRVPPPEFSGPLEPLPPPAPVAPQRPEPIASAAPTPPTLPRRLDLRPQQPSTLETLLRVGAMAFNRPMQFPNTTAGRVMAPLLRLGQSAALVGSEQMREQRLDPLQRKLETIQQMFPGVSEDRQMELALGIQPMMVPPESSMVSGVTLQPVMEPTRRPVRPSFSDISKLTRESQQIVIDKLQRGEPIAPGDWQVDPLAGLGGVPELTGRAIQQPETYGPVLKEYQRQRIEEQKAGSETAAQARMELERVLRGQGIAEMKPETLVSIRQRLEAENTKEATATLYGAMPFRNPQEKQDYEQRRNKRREMIELIDKILGDRAPKPPPGAAPPAPLSEEQRLMDEAKRRAGLR